MHTCLPSARLFQTPPSGMMVPTREAVDTPTPPSSTSLPSRRAPTHLARVSAERLSTSPTPSRTHGFSQWLLMVSSFFMWRSLPLLWPFLTRDFFSFHLLSPLSSSSLLFIITEAVDVPEHYLNISRVTFQELADLDEETLVLSYTFVDAVVPEWVEPKAAAAPAASPKKQASSSKPKAVAAPAPAPSSSSSSSAKSAPTSSSKKAEQAHPAPAAPVTTSSSKKAEQAHYAPVTTSSSKKVEQQKQYTPPTTTSSSKKQVYTPKTTPEVKKPAYTPKTTSSKKAVETPKKPSTGSSGGQFVSSFPFLLPRLHARLLMQFFRPLPPSTVRPRNMVHPRWQCWCLR
jgi:hypothetical protein